MITVKGALVGGLLSALCIGAAPTPTFCPENYYESCGLLGCICLPKIDGDIGRGAEHIKKETQAQTIGRALEQWLNGSRNSAIGTAMPIPMQVRNALTGYIDETSMNQVRFKVGDNGVLNLANLSITYGDKFGNDVQAVTLVDVVVFRNEADAYNNMALWAHELTHVKQFREWGTNNFAISYARDVGSVENPAYQVGDGYDGWAKGRVFTPVPRPDPPRVPPPIVTGFPSGQPMTTCGCWGNGPVVAPENRCQSGRVQAVACQGWCQLGGSPYGYVCQ